MARPDSEVEPDLRGDPIRDPEIHQVVRSAGYSVECPAALFYSLEVDGRTVSVPCSAIGDEVSE